VEGLTSKLEATGESLQTTERHLVEAQTTIQHNAEQIRGLEKDLATTREGVEKTTTELARG
jgi:predicted  nucleic acid-binding Zn-ribbon protein